MAPEAGQVIAVPPTGYYAFVPSKLPPTIRYDAALATQLSKADANLGELSGLGAQLPNAHLLISPYLRREAVLSSRIEGTRASLSDLFRQEAGLQSEDADVMEVQNYVLALQLGLARLHDLPLSLRLVRELHGRLMEGVRGEYATPGEFRRSQNWIGGTTATPDTADFVPPPPPQMLEALDDWEKFLHVRADIPVLIQCSLVHEQFEAIHPFLDGNGRVGRLLIPLFLIERGRLSQPLLYVSFYFEAHRREYYERLQRVRTHGDWYGWITFFLKAIEETGRTATAQASQVLNLRERFRSQLSGNARALALVDRLFVNPYISASQAQDALAVSPNTARNTIMVLVKAGILVEITGRRWGRAYLAGPVMEAMEGHSMTAGPQSRLATSAN